MLLPAIALTLITIAPASFIRTQAQPSSPAATADTCPVTGKAIPAGQGVKVKVRNREYLVFDADAAAELKANPDKYLEADGTPKTPTKAE